MKILKFPELRQSYSWDCGATAIHSVLAYYNIDVAEEIIIKIAKTTRRSGTSISGVKAVAGNYDLNCQAGKMAIKDIKKYIDKKIPVILLLQAWSKKKNVKYEREWFNGHFVVAIGYDSKKIYFEDPGSIFRTFLTYEELQKRWHDCDVGGKKYWNWGMAVFNKRRKTNKYLLKTMHMD